MAEESYAEKITSISDITLVTIDEGTELQLSSTHPDPEKRKADKSLGLDCAILHVTDDAVDIEASYSKNVPAAYRQAKRIPISGTVKKTVPKMVFVMDSKGAIGAVCLDVPTAGQLLTHAPETFQAGQGHVALSIFFLR